MMLVTIPGAHGEVDVFEHLVAAKGFGQMADFQNCLAHVSGPPLSRPCFSSCRMRSRSSLLRSSKGVPRSGWL